MQEQRLCVYFYDEVAVQKLSANSFPQIVAYIRTAATIFYLQLRPTSLQSLFADQLQMGEYSAIIHVALTHNILVGLFVIRNKHINPAKFEEIL